MANQSPDRLYAQLQMALGKITEKEVFSLASLSSLLVSIRSFLQKLRELIKEQPFRDQQEEINFFKFIKPRFYAEQIYHVALYNLTFHLPSGTMDMQKVYFLSELDQLRRFYQLNSFYYQYYRSGLSELDHLYFLRGTQIGSGYIPDPGDPDSGFSTALDDLFSRFIAYERLEAYILKKLNDDCNTSFKNGLIAKKRCKWTGSKVGIVELAYGLYYSGEINRGEAEVQDIIVVLEEAFEIAIGDGHRKFVDVRNRKNSSPTQLLDKMREAIMQRVEEDLVYRANRGIKLRKPLR